jgi:predicted GNAT superfamily acetyltransferase
MQIQYDAYTSLPSEPQMGQLLDLLAQIFTNQSREEWLADLTSKATTNSGFQLLLAVVDDQLVGCKVGYAYNSASNESSTFYSWLGGVSPDFRGKGLAGELMRRQHEWCKECGYSAIRTHTYNQWRDMLILNLKHDFQIIGTKPGKHGLTIVLEKALV